jgi:serine protease
MPRLRPSLIPLLLAVVTGSAVAAQPAAAADPSREVVARFRASATPAQVARALRDAGAVDAGPAPQGARLLRLRPGRSAQGASDRLLATNAVADAGPRLVARASGFTPNDTGLAGRSGTAGGWAAQEWDLTGPFGIHAPEAWAAAARLGHPGGRGVTVGIVDTGIAYSNRPPYRRSPDIAPARVVRGYDFVDNDPYPNDRNGHGTFVAGVVAAAADNGYGMIGVAYQAKLMPVRVLDGDGAGTGTRIARGLRWAVDHGANVLNVSIELYDRLTLQAQSMTTDPAIRDAVRYAARHNVLVVAASGNSSSQSVPSTRLGSDILYVGGSTEHGCLGDYSNHGPGLDLVAPGGGRDADFPDDPRCNQTQRGRNVLQVSFKRPDFGRFQLVRDSSGRPGFKGTSMAAPHATGVVALLLTSGVLGSHPTPQAIQARLRATAQDLGAPGPDARYGAGLLNAAAALSGVPAR